MRCNGAFSRFCLQKRPCRPIKSMKILGLPRNFPKLFSSRCKLVTLAAVRPPESLSLRRVLSLSIDDVTIEICKRCQQQYDELCIYPETRPISILKALYSDTILKVGVFQGRHSVEKKAALDRLIGAQIESLEHRHGMVTETLVDVMLSLDPIEESTRLSGTSTFLPKQHLQESLKSILHRQASLSVLLQHGVGLTSPKMSHNGGCVIESDMLALCLGVKNQATTLANHHFNWSPEIRVTVLTSETVDQHRQGGAKVLCIPSFARFILLETIKNALHATAEVYQSNHPNLGNLIDSPENENIPVVQVNLISSTESFQVQVIDEGYGMTEEELNESKGFMWASTMKPR